MLANTSVMPVFRNLLQAAVALATRVLQLVHRSSAALRGWPACVHWSAASSGVGKVAGLANCSDAARFERTEVSTHRARCCRSRSARTISVSSAGLAVAQSTS